MVEKGDKFNRIITAALAVIIIIAAAVLLYINLPQSSDTQDNEQQDGGMDTNETTTLLTVIFGSEQTNYTLDELEAIEAYIGNGTYIKIGWLPDVILEGPHTYTGVRITTLLDQFEDFSENYTITVEASDGYTKNYNFSYITGHVDIYNESGNITGNGEVTLLLAYKEDGEYINESSDGPLRMVYIDKTRITSSNLWVKNVISIEVNEF